MNWITKLERKYGRFCIPNLINILIGGQILVYAIELFVNQYISFYLSLSRSALFAGQIWRLFTFVFIPQSTSPLGLVLTLYFYYLIGNTLENTWGDFQFNVYYLCGMLGAILAAALTGYGTSYYINLSLFFAFAMLYPDFQVLLFFIIPIKIKWLAIIDGAFFAIEIVGAILSGNLVGAITPVLALLNFALFATPYIHYMRRKTQYRHSAGAVNFRRTVHQAQKQQQNAPYHHKCAVCGRTDTDYPDLQFRYCSKCTGYHCFCQDHIFSHVHFTEEP